MTDKENKPRKKQIEEAEKRGYARGYYTGRKSSGRRTPASKKTPAPRPLYNPHDARDRYDRLMVEAMKLAFEHFADWNLCGKKPENISDYTKIATTLVSKMIKANPYG